MAGSYQAACTSMLGSNKPTFSGTMTVGNDGSTFKGYSVSAPAIGSLSPDTMSDTRTITRWADVFGGGVATIVITGFGADPGQSYVTQFTAGGTTKTTASASVYNYSAGTASWTWASTFGFGLSGSVACSSP